MDDDKSIQNEPGTNRTPLQRLARNVALCLDIESLGAALRDDGSVDLQHVETKAYLDVQDVATIIRVISGEGVD